MSSRVGSHSYGLKMCDCCCGAEVEHSNYNCAAGYMSCSKCGCRKIMDFGVIVVRVAHEGQMTVGSLRQMLDTAETLAASDDIKIVIDKESGQVYADVPAEGFSTKREIARIRREAVARTSK
jgi:hypothetical protein